MRPGLRARGGRRAAGRRAAGGANNGAPLGPNFDTNTTKVKTCKQYRNSHRCMATRAPLPGAAPAGRSAAAAGAHGSAARPPARPPPPRTALPLKMKLAPRQQRGQEIWRPSSLTVNRYTMAPRLPGGGWRVGAGTAACWVGSQALQRPSTAASVRKSIGLALRKMNGRSVTSRGSQMLTQVNDPTQHPKPGR